MSAIKSPNYFQFPNEVLEDYNLSDSAFRVFAAIVRKTLGWQKKRDKISISQLMKLSKKSRSTVLRAVAELEKCGLIEVRRVVGETTQYCVNFDTGSTNLIPVQSKSDTGGVSELDTQKKLSKDTQQKKESPEYTAALRYFYESHEGEQGYKPAWNGKTGKLLKQDIARLKEIDLDRWFDLFKIFVVAFVSDQFSDHVTKFTQSAGHGYNVFHGCLEQMISDYATHRRSG